MFLIFQEIEHSSPKNKKYQERTFWVLKKFLTFQNLHGKNHQNKFYTWDVNWAWYLWGVYSGERGGREAYVRGAQWREFTGGSALAGFYGISLLLFSFYNVANSFTNFNIFITKIFIFYPKIHTFSFIKIFSIYNHRKDSDKTKCMYFWIKDENFFDKYIEIWEKLATL